MNHFDTKAAGWDLNPAHLERSQAIARAMRQRVPMSRSTRALEVGCGTGLLSFELHADLGPITLTDTSEGMLEVLRAKIAAQGIPNMEPRLLDLATESLPAGSFDLIYLQLVLHHLPDVEGTLRTFRDLLAPGGHLCIADLEHEDGSFHGEGFSGHHGFEPAHLAAQVAQLGFQGLSTETVCHIHRDGSSQLFPVFLLVAKKP